MRRILAVLVGLIIVSALAWWGFRWASNGGWPASGPVGDALPPNIRYVRPADGESLAESFGYCVYFNYDAGYGMDVDSRQTIRYFFGGLPVDKQVVDVTEIEYPLPEGQPCYKRDDLLKPGWHSARVTYQNNHGNQYEYNWRFLVVEQE